MNAPNIGIYKTPKSSGITIRSHSQYDQRFLAEFRVGKQIKQTFIHTTCHLEDRQYYSHIGPEMKSQIKKCSDWLRVN